MTRAPRKACPKTAADEVLTPFDLMRAPQLAALILLETAIHAARLALFAEHPELIDPDAGLRRPDPGAAPAARLLDRAHDLHLAVRAYRLAIANDPLASADDDIPF